MIYCFQCQECEREQEIECKLAEKDNQSCSFCGAPPEKMKSIINLNTKTYKVHLSASQWKVEVGD
jgi:predicted nucleic acid-binding Zn ribbon protein